MESPKVMLATLVDEPFDHPEWIFETKWDGVRATCHIDSRAGMTLVSRTGQDLTGTFPELGVLRRAFSGLPITVDGEVVTLDQHGRSSFQRLQARINRLRPTPREIEAVPVHYVVFDVMEHRGKDVRGLPLEQRREILKAAIVAHDSVLAFSKDVRGEGCAAFAAAERTGLEGIMAKRLGSRYVGKRSRDWLKIKVHQRQEFVIGGWTEPRGSRQGFGALLLGVYDDGARLRYVGSVGTGFDETFLRSLSQRLKAIETTSAPFDKAPSTATAAHWVKPQLVAEVRFAEWTHGGSIRQPAFVGIRSDKQPRDVRHEVPSDPTRHRRAASTRRYRPDAPRGRSHTE